MSQNPHMEGANACYGAISSEAATEFNEQLRADALIQATLALAWETARCADEARTANIIASMNPVEMNDGTVARVQWEAAKRRLDQVKERIEATP